MGKREHTFNSTQKMRANRTEDTDKESRHATVSDSYLNDYNMHMRRKELAQKTIERRIRIVELVAEQLGDPLETTTSELEHFLDSRSLSAKTRATWVSHLAQYFKWCQMMGFTERDPTLLMVRPRQRHYFPRPISEAEFQRALAASKTTLMTAWLMLAGMQGLRCAEISALTTRRIDGDTMRVIGKGQKERALPIHPAVHAALADHGMPLSGPIFIDPALNDSYTAEHVSRIMSRYLRSIGIDAVPHQLRHRAGTEMLEAAGGNIRLVQEFLGHQSIATTQLYTQVKATHLRDAVLNMKAAV